jgi:hypothetical protein
MRRLLTSFILITTLIGVAAPAIAAPHADRSDVVGAAKADLQRIGKDLSGPCGALLIVKVAAWRLRSDGAGLLSKPSGNNCDGFAVDIIAYSDGEIYDVLADSGGENRPSWGSGGNVGADRYRAAVDPGFDTSTAPSPPTPVPIPTTVLSPDLIAQAVRLALFADFDRLYNQTERIYQDETNQHSSNQTALIAEIDQPGWFKQLVKNPVFLSLTSGVATCLTTRCWK